MKTAHTPLDEARTAAHAPRAQPAVALPGCTFYPADVDHGWAGASDWAATRPLRTVSCVLLAQGDLCGVETLLPRLCAQLDDCGYPFELIIVVDAASGRGAEWACEQFDRPGHRLVVLDEPLTDDAAATLGIGLARGDAIVIVDARTRQTLRMVTWMIARWALGDRLQYVGPIAGTGVADSRLGECGDMLLLDREVVKRLLDDA
ncbi:MAG: hypothetical protein JNJ42_19605 [Burkholderiaceae bacterium]|nr:hypothetical protein [Burkholderiaceae bacterium]